MKKRIRHPDYPKITPHISGAVLLDNGWVFVSGQGPLDMATGAVCKGSIEEETLLTLKNIEAILRAAGCEPCNVVKCTCYLADLADFSGFNRTYQEFFTQDVPPARTTVQAELLNGILVEIDAVAVFTPSN